MTELKVGKVNSKELAAWFGISAEYFRKREIKQKYLDILTKYAHYHLVAKGNGLMVVIDEVLEAEYKGEKGSPSRQRIKELVEQNWNPSGLDSCSRVADQNYPILQAEGFRIAESTNYKYTCDGRTELWGSPMKRSHGEHGYCRYEYCKKGPEGELIPLSEEEQKIKHEVTKRYFGNLEDFTLGIVEDIRQKKISAEEAGQAIANLAKHGDYLAWKEELETRLQCKIYKGTRVYLEEGAF